MTVDAHQEILTIQSHPPSANQTAEPTVRSIRSLCRALVVLVTTALAGGLLAGCAAMAPPPDPVGNPRTQAPTVVVVETTVPDGPILLATATPVQGDTPNDRLGDADEPPARDARRLSARGGNRSVDAASATPTPTPSPSPTPAPVSQRREIVTHRVVPGDNVTGIAERFGISPKTILQANALADPERLPVGQELLILPVNGFLHTVSEGDNVIALATRYGAIPEAIVAANDLADPALIRPGQQLIIPLVSAARQAAAVMPVPLAKPLEPLSYQVHAGDTLNGIAARFGLSVESVRWANDIPNADALAVGQELAIPPVDGVLHRVVPGESIVAIAALYGASAAEVIRVNALTEPAVLQVGQRLVVPGGRPPARQADRAPAKTPTPK